MNYAKVWLEEKFISLSQTEKEHYIQKIINNEDNFFDKELENILFSAESQKQIHPEYDFSQIPVRFFETIFSHVEK